MKKKKKVLEAKSKNTSNSRVYLSACNDLQRSGECLIDDIVSE